MCRIGPKWDQSGTFLSSPSHNVLTIIVKSLIITEISVNLVEFLAKSDTHALNAHDIVSRFVGKIYCYLFYMIFLIPSPNFLKIDRSKSDNE